TDHRTCDEDPHGPNGAASSGSPVPFAPPRTRRTPARRYSPATPSWHSSASAADLLPPFAMYVPLARADYYRGSATVGALSRRRACPPPPRRGGRHQTASHVHHHPVDEQAAQLYPGSLATPTPQTFSVASPPGPLPGFGVATSFGGVRCTRPISARL